MRRAWVGGEEFEFSGSCGMKLTARAGVPEVVDLGCYRKDADLLEMKWEVKEVKRVHE